LAQMHRAMSDSMMTTMESQISTAMRRTMSESTLTDTCGTTYRAMCRAVCQAICTAVNQTTTRAMCEAACRPVFSTTSGDSARLKSVEIRAQPQAVSRKSPAVLTACRPMSAATICGLQVRRRRGLPAVYM
jgi:hypothetical protein